MSENDELAKAAQELYSEPTTHKTEDKCLPNGQSAVSYPEGFQAKINRRQVMQENNINIGLL